MCVGKYVLVVYSIVTIHACTDPGHGTQYCRVMQPCIRQHGTHEVERKIKLVLQVSRIKYKERML